MHKTAFPELNARLRSAKTGDGEILTRVGVEEVNELNSRLP